MPNIFTDNKWAVHISGPDDLHAAESFEVANQKAYEINKQLIELHKDDSDPDYKYTPIIYASVMLWPYEADTHDPTTTDWGDV